jgi:hypothetical protein
MWYDHDTFGDDVDDGDVHDDDDDDDLNSMLMKL